ncbi:hypothetical protein [Catenulispora sp. EB89]|uniref:hypothetical protein n=1 Tax=Catenulispora sp. EB89 TaxID=3156257 RepID=UPI003516CF1E
MKTKPQAWFFGTEPPTPVAPWGQGGPSRKLLLGLGVGLLVLIAGGGGVVAAVTGSSGSSTSAGSAGSGLPTYGLNDSNGNGDGSVFGGGATSPTDTAAAPSETSLPTPTSSSYQFPDFISAPTDSAAPFTGDSSVLGAWEGQAACGSHEVGIMLEDGAAGGDHVSGFWDAYSLTGAADLASTGSTMIGLADSGHLAVRGDLAMLGGGIQVGSFDGTLSADGNDLTGPMSGCVSQTVDLKKQQLLTGAQDPLPGKWSDGQGGTWTFTSTGAGQYTGSQSDVSGCAIMYKFTLTGYDGHYAGQAAPLTNSGCTTPIVTDLAALNISAQDGTAVVELDGAPKLTLTKAGGGASGTGTPSGTPSATGASSTSSPSTPGGSAGTSSSVN